MKIATHLIALAIASMAASVVWAQDPGWPRVVKDGGTQVVIYQPQPDSLDGVTLESRVAVSIKRPQDKTPLFGALWVIAQLDVDRDRDVARVASLRVDRTRFAGVAESDVQALVRFVEADAPQWDFSISLTRLKASLQAADAGPDADYRNDPPKIVVVDTPAILLLLDGPPKLQDIGSGGLQKVVNTALPVIFDSRNTQYWFYGSSVWFTTNNLLRGSWRATDNAPANIAQLVKDSDTLAEAQDDAGKAASPAELRKARIVVATEPTELIVTEGAPKYSPLVGGDLLYVTNTDSDLFLETATQRHFVAISGRWFAAPSPQGPWSFVAPENLPPSFAKIPENSPKANVLTFVPGTDRAKDAVMDSVIPQTAEVIRSEARIDVPYDGPPRFSPIPNTSLSYAQNTPSQVIRDGRRYYACEQGVWYVADQATGPWSVSDSRPSGLDEIPPSSPVYNTKYVYIYDSTPEVVYVGYLPGYRWSFPYHGVLYYGTGWQYRGWFGRYYYPRPATWGFLVRYDPWTGWSYGMSWTAGWLGITSHWGSGWAGWMPVYGPGYRMGFWSGYYAGGWFGPGGYRPPRPHYGRPPVRPGGQMTIQPYPYPIKGHGGRPGNNLYTRPGNQGVRPRPERPGAVTGPGRPQAQPGRRGGTAPENVGPATGGRGAGRGPGRGTRPDPVTKPDPRLPNDVYTDRDGNVHRNRGGNWQTRQDRTWKPEGAPPAPRPAPPATAPQPPAPQQQRPPRPTPPQAAPTQPAPRPQGRPTIQTEPRGGGSIDGERDARNRGSRMAPDGQPNRRKP